MEKAGKGQPFLPTLSNPFLPTRGRGTLDLVLFISASEPYSLTCAVKMSSKQSFSESKIDWSFPIIYLSEFLESMDIDMNKLNKYIFLKGRESTRGRGRGRRRESQADTPLSAEPDWGLDPMTLRSRPEPKSGVRRLTDWATQAPQQGPSKSSVQGRWEELRKIGRLTGEKATATVQARNAK